MKQPNLVFIPDIIQEREDHLIIEIVTTEIQNEGITDDEIIIIMVIDETTIIIDNEIIEINETIISIINKLPVSDVSNLDIRHHTVMN